VLVAEGVFGPDGFVELPPPTPEEVEAVLSRMLRRLLPFFEKVEEVPWPEDGHQALQHDSAQQRLALHLGAEEQAPRRRARRGLVAVGQGFSLHAGTWVHANDREGLLRLVRYGARSPVAQSRLSRRDDGRYVYRTKKGLELVLTAQQLVRRLLALIPPRYAHGTNFHGVFASHANARAGLLPAPTGAAALVKEDVRAPRAHAAPAAGPTRRRRPRVDWATLHQRTWAVDVWQCPCGGRRRVVAVVTSPSTAEAMLRNMGRLPPREPLPLAQAPPQGVLPLS
jgi:hypothetical protein